VILRFEGKIVLIAWHGHHLLSIMQTCRAMHTGEGGVH
jgi:hypothetical protein